MEALSLEGSASGFSYTPTCLQVEMTEGEGAVVPSPKSLEGSASTPIAPKLSA